MEASKSVSINTIVPETLDDSNYELWSSCMEDYLLSQDLWDVVIEDEPELADHEESSSDLRKQNMKSWRKRNASALHAIKVSCGPNFLPQVVKLKSAKEAWNYLLSTVADSEKLKEQSTDHDSDNEVEDETRSAVREGLEDEEESSTDSDVEVEDETGSPVPEVFEDAETIDDDDEDELDYDPFVEATLDGEWSNMEKFINDHPQALTAPLFANGRTALHHMLAVGQEMIAVSLVERMAVEDLEIQDGDGYTTLAVGATERYPSQLKLLHLIASKNPKLTQIGSPARIPVIIASWKGYTDATRFLYSITDKDILSPECGIVGGKLLNNCINIKLFDIASELVEKFPELLKQSYGGIYPIHALAKSFSSFSSTNYGQEKSNWAFKYAQQLLGYCSLVKDDKLIHDQALALLRLVCVEISSFDTNTLRVAVYDAMMEAAIHGNVEFINEMLKANPTLIDASRNEKSVFTHAVANRQEKVFSLVYGAIERKDSLLSCGNEENNNILHYAAMLAPPSALDRTSGDALQMQRELQWFKEVWNVAKARYREDLNVDDLTPRELFTKKHKDLMDAGEKSMKDTAQSSTVVGALIVTIMFAAAFTVPGGNNQNTGFPLFVSQVLFKIFIICDALSLYSSATSVLVFLGILTSRYAEDDFLLILPRKLMIGISTLFFSIATMMMTFCAALAMMLDGRLQLIFPIVLLAFVPVILFLSSIFPLLSKMYMSTFGPSIFDKDIKLPSKKEYKKIMKNPSTVDVELDSKKEEKKITNSSLSVDQIV